MENDQQFICGAVEGFYGRPWTADQRRHLFKHLRRKGMNTYLYAPKDDLKHRAEWRILYNLEEASVLQSLISAANENEITFIYALSPGIDVIYSSPKEIRKVIDKLSQVRSLGCTSFALLFDDIEPSMKEVDKKKFISFAEAQICLTNDVYEFLGSPKIFLFCPTEYCESRAVPSLEQSEYLATIGKKLNLKIHVLWTGPRVVSRTITKEHIQRVSKVLRRKPLIWDNLHANDYDPKRVFFGPFAGRSVTLKKEISGLLLNPNTKYEANFIPLFTLGEWFQYNEDKPYTQSSMDKEYTSPARAEESKKTSEKPFPLLDSLKRALDEWFLHLKQGPGPVVPPISEVETKTIIPVIADSIAESSISKSADSSIPPPTIRTCEGNEMLLDIPAHPPIYTTSTIGSATTVTVQAVPLMETIIGYHENNAQEIPQTLNSLTADYGSSMEINELSSFSEVEEQQPSVSFTETEQNQQQQMDVSSKPSRSNSLDYAMSEDVSMGQLDRIEAESIALLVDIFYLPFEHGERAKKFLDEFYWLFENVGAVQKPITEADQEQWTLRYQDFRTVEDQLYHLYNLMTTNSPNKSFVQEIFPYLWEVQAIVSIVTALLEWMRRGNLIKAPTELECHQRNTDLDVEPWALGGGFIPDLQKRIVTSSNIMDLFTIKSSIHLSIHCYTINPLDSVEDVEKGYVYESFATMAEKEFLKPNFTKSVCEEFFFDKTFRPFLKFGTPAHHFIAQRQDVDLPYLSVAVGILNFAEVEKNITEYFDSLKEKYAGFVNGDEKSIQMVNEFLGEQPQTFFHDNKELLERYPSMIEIRSKDFVDDAISVRRLLHCISASLALNGSTGFFTVINYNDHERYDLYLRLGLEVIFEAFEEKKQSYVILGHLI